MAWLGVALVLACGPSTAPIGDDGSGGGSANTGDGSDAGDDGATSAADGMDDTTTGPGDGGEAEATSAVDSGGDDGTQAECLLAIRIDQCCNQAFPATPAEVAPEDCIVPWPIDWESLPGDLVASCADAQPEQCDLVDCDYAPPPVDVVEVGPEGECVFVCPEETGLAYAQPGCGEPPPIAECLPPPPPCADEYCSCEGETIIGCGQTGEPFEHMGRCR